MDQELKQKWVSALRSGEYKQGIGSLRTVENCLCCLGVLCVIAGWEINETGFNAEINGNRYNVYGEMKKMGIPAETLFHMNDHEGKNFSEIADFIEQKL